MTRFLAPVVCVLTSALVCAPVGAAEPPKKLTPEERKELDGKLREALIAGNKAYQAGKLVEATKSFEEAMKVVRQLYDKAQFPDGHPNLASSLNNLGVLYHAQGKWADAEPCSRRRWRCASACSRTRTMPTWPGA
jgi:hypothetical protein